MAALKLRKPLKRHNKEIKEKAENILAVKLCKCIKSVRTSKNIKINNKINNKIIKIIKINFNNNNILIIIIIIIII